MKCSIVMSTRNKEVYLQHTLKSIRQQSVPFEYEIIVVDDGSRTTKTEYACLKYKVERYVRLENPEYRNPSMARNAGYRLAKGDVIIAQSDDVIHHSTNAIERLTLDLTPGEFRIATVWNFYYFRESGKEKRGILYTGVDYPRPFFFLGSLWRKDLYAVGGNDEEFTSPGYDDDWFGDCLIHGLGLRCTFVPEVEGRHQDHPRPAGWKDMHEVSRVLYEKKFAQAKAGDIPWQASGGPWTWKH